MLPGCHYADFREALAVLHPGSAPRSLRSFQSGQVSQSPFAALAITSVPAGRLSLNKGLLRLADHLASRRACGHQAVFIHLSFEYSLSCKGLIEAVNGAGSMETCFLCWFSLLRPHPADLPARLFSQLIDQLRYLEIHQTPQLMTCQRRFHLSIFNHITWCFFELTSRLPRPPNHSGIFFLLMHLITSRRSIGCSGLVRDKPRQFGFRHTQTICTTHRTSKCTVHPAAALLDES